MHLRAFCPSKQNNGCEGRAVALEISILGGEMWGGPALFNTDLTGELDPARSCLLRWPYGGPVEAHRGKLV